MLSIFIFGVILFCIVFLSIIACFFPMKYRAYIIESCDEFDLNPALVASVINAESRFNKDVISNKGAIGLMQLLPTTACELAKKLDMSQFTSQDLYTPDVNIRLGTYYLSTLISEFIDINTALCAYNAGPGTVKNWLSNNSYSQNQTTLDNIPYKETRNYVRKVSLYQKIYVGYF